MIIGRAVYARPGHGAGWPSHAVRPYQAAVAARRGCTTGRWMTEIKERPELNRCVSAITDHGVTRI